MTIQDYDWYEATAEVVEIFDHCVAEAREQQELIQRTVERFGAEEAFGRRNIEGLSFTGPAPKQWKRVGRGRRGDEYVNIYLPKRTSKARRADFDAIKALIRPSPQRAFGGRLGGQHMAASGTTITIRSPHLALRRYLGIPKGYPLDQIAIPIASLTAVRTSDVMRALEDYEARIDAPPPTETPETEK